MTETPEQRVARLEAELAQAKVDALKKQLAAAQAGVAAPARAGPAELAPAGAPAGVDLGKEDRLRAKARAAMAALQPEGLHAELRTAPAGSGGFASTWAPDAGLPDTRLAPAPRDIPGKFRLIGYPFKFWTLWALFMISVTPLAVWIFVPLAGAITVGLTFLVLTYLTVRRRRLWHALLKWGEVATVTGTEVLSRGTYYSGTTYSNVRLAQADGWKVTRKWYSGPAYKTRVNYQVGTGGTGSLVIRGLPYQDGVILADPRHPARALCVSSFPYDIEPDHYGNWATTISNRVLLSSALMTLIVLAWTAGLMLLFVHVVSVDGPVNS